MCSCSSVGLEHWSYEPKVSGSSPLSSNLVLITMCFKYFVIIVCEFSFSFFCIGFYCVFLCVFFRGLHLPAFYVCLRVVRLLGGLHMIVEEVDMMEVEVELEEKDAEKDAENDAVKGEYISVLLE